LEEVGDLVVDFEVGQPQDLAGRGYPKERIHVEFPSRYSISAPNHLDHGPWMLVSCGGMLSQGYQVAAYGKERN
jgi:hypothetical protein